MKRLTYILFAAGCLLVAPGGWIQALAETIPYRFATRAEAQMLITEIDRYTTGWNQFDLDVRLQMPNGKKSKLLMLAMESTRHWSEDDKSKMNNAIRRIEEAIQKKKLVLHFPDEVVLVKTSMVEEGGAAAYTRENWIAVGEEALARLSEEDLACLMAHELFHILTRSDAAFKQKAYGVIGFTVAERSIVFPNDLMVKMISNPDAGPDSYAPFTVGGEMRNCVMVIYTDRPYTEGTLMQYIRVGLVPLNEELVPVQQDGVTVIYSPDQVEDFQVRLGRNTAYMIGPEEVLADNFMYLLFNKEDLSDPQIVEALGAALM